MITILDGWGALELVPNCQIAVDSRTGLSKMRWEHIKYLKCQEGAANITFEQEEEKSLLIMHIYSSQMKAAEKAHKN